MINNGKKHKWICWVEWMSFMLKQSNNNVFNTSSSSFKLYWIFLNQRKVKNIHTAHLIFGKRPLISFISTKCFCYHSTSLWQSFGSICNHKTSRDQFVFFSVDYSALRGLGTGLGENPPQRAVRLRGLKQRQNVQG